MQSLQDLADVEAVKPVHLRYCRAIDRMDWELSRSYYHPDGIDDHGDFVGGIEEFIAYAKVNLPTFRSTAHHVTNQIVEIAGDEARAEHYGIDYHRLPAADGLG